MRYTAEIEINLPKDKVVELFNNPENLRYWQAGFLSMEHLGGNRGEEGAISLLRYRIKKRDIEYVETVVKKDLPHKYYGIYEADGIWNGVRNHFHKVNNNKTMWKSYQEFKFKGKMKITAILSPGTFKKQSQKNMELFKLYAERA
ncbi:SRPBCC family protein [Bacteroidota bacterium]